MSAVTITYLQMLDRTRLRAKPMPHEFAVNRVTPADGAVNERFYRAVGADWAWRDRLGWSLDQWRTYAERDALSTWIARFDGDEVGYAELERQDAGDVQIAYFGLLPAHVGRGLGGPLLTRVIELAWAIPGTRRLWLHTCTGDHPAALPNYLARGFEVYRGECGASTPP